MNGTIGIIGYGFVGKAVDQGFSKSTNIISDPKYNKITIEDVCNKDPDAIFVCVPTPTDGSNFKILKDVLSELKEANYSKLIVVKSTVLPDQLNGFDVLYNPEFLSRGTAYNDFIRPPMVLIGGNRGSELVDVYRKYSDVCMDTVILTDIKTASLAKYTMNSFYATKITFLNSIFEVAQSIGVDYNDIAEILKHQPWMGTHHFQVPGPDGNRGFGGPCLPKDTEALANEYDIKLLKMVLDLNKTYREV